MMKRLARRALLTGVCSMTALSSVPAHAQTAGSADQADETPLVGDIVVTAQKRSERINDIGMSIDALTGDTLRNQGVTQIADLVKSVPGLNYTKSSYGLPVYTIRGVGYNETSLAASPTVSVYLDEVPLPLSSMSNGVAFDLERVEVLKGPQGTLFGQNSTGGAINFIAAKPTGDWQTGFSVTAGRFQQIDSEAYLSGPLSSTLRMRAAIRKEYAGAWQRSYTRDDELGQVDRTLWRAQIEWRPTDRLTVALNANGWMDRSDQQAGQLVGFINTTATLPAVLRTYPLSPENPRAADWDPISRFKAHHDFYQVSGRFDYDFGGDVTLTSISAYDDLTIESLTDTDGTAIQNFNVRQHGYNKTFTQEARLAGRISQSIRWVIGGNYQWDRVIDATQPRTAISSAAFRSAEARSRNRVNTYAAFGNLDWELVDGLTLQGGVRYTEQRRRYDGCLYDLGAGDLSGPISRLASALTRTTVVIAPGSCVTLGADNLPAVYNDTLREDSVSWRTSLNWKVTPSALLYASVSRGYKNGNYVTTGATSFKSLFPATQESVLAYEGGFKLSLLNGTMQLNGAGFYYDYRDKQVRGRIPDPVFVALNRLLNVPKSRIVGGELQLQWRPVRSLSLSGGATYVNSRILGVFNNFTALNRPKDLGGESFPLTPRWQLTGDAQYDVPLSSSVIGFVGAGATYQSATNAAVGAEPLLAMKAYTLVDLRAGIHDVDDRWRLSGFVRNVGNAYYLTNVVAPSVDTVIRYAGRPRTYGLTLSYRYR